GLVIAHNTALQSGSIVLTDSSSEQNLGLVYRDNIEFHNAYGVFGGGVGDHALSNFFPDAVFDRNVLIGPWPTSGGATPSDYSQHPDNFFPSSIAEVGFVNSGAADYRLTGSSPYKSAASDGTDIGVDFDALDAAQSSTSTSSLSASAPPAL